MQSPSSPNEPKQKQRGSGFTNIQKVLSANKGNQLGSAVSQGLQQRAENTQQAVNKAADRFGQQMQQGSLGADQKAQRENVLNRVEQGQGVQDSDIQAFSRFRSGDYTGPKGIEDKEKLLQQADRGQQMASSVGTQEGRQGLLQQFNPTAKYTRGTMKTDALFLGQAAPQLQQAASGLRGASRDVTQAARVAEGQAQKAALETKAFGEETNKMLQERLSGVENPILERQKAAKDLYVKQQADLGNLQQALTGKIDFSIGGDKDTVRKESLDRYAQTLGLDQQEVEGLKTQYDALRKAGLNDEQAGRSLFEAVGLKQQDLSNLENLGVFKQQDELTKLNALKQLSGKEADQYAEGILGSYKADDATADVAGLGGLAKARSQANEIKSQMDRLSHYVTNAKAASANAVKGTSQSDRNFFIERDPELAALYAQRDKLASTPVGGGMGGREAERKRDKEFDKLVTDIGLRQNKVISGVQSELPTLQNRQARLGSVDSLQAYRDYLNSNPTVKY